MNQVVGIKIRIAFKNKMPQIFHSVDKYEHTQP